MFLSHTNSLYMFNSFVIKKLLFSVFHQKQQHYHSLYVTVWWLLKEPLGFYGNLDMFILRSRTECVPVVSARTRRPWRWRSFSWRARVSNGITNDVLQEHLQHTAGLLVDQTGDTLHSAAASETTDGGFGNACPGYYPANFTVTLSASFPESLTSFASSRHDYNQSYEWRKRICEKSSREAFYICLPDLTEINPASLGLHPSPASSSRAQGNNVV